MTGIVGQRTKQAGNSWPHPAVQDKKLYIRVQDDLLCYDISGGNRVP